MLTATNVYNIEYISDIDGYLTRDPDYSSEKAKSYLRNKISLNTQFMFVIGTLTLCLR